MWWRPSRISPSREGIDIIPGYQRRATVSEPLCALLVAHPSRSTGEQKSSARAASRRCLGVRFCTTETDKPTRGFTLDKRFQGCPHDGRFFGDARILLRLCEQFVVNRDRGFHDITLQRTKYSNI
jgi:hypothetical protein